MRIINEDKRVINNNSQWQGQLLINQWASQGNKVVWECKEVPEGKGVETLNILHPISSLYSKFIIQKGTWYIIYPTIFQEVKK